MRGKKWFILLVILGVVLLASGTGVTRSSFVDPGSSTGNAFQAWASTPWVQTTQADFEAGVLNNVDTSSSPGNVRLATTSNWYDTNWQYRREITIDHTKVDSVLTHFPVLVKLTSLNFDFSKARSDGYDIRFASSDGTTLLKYERERHDAVGGVAEYWVKIPSVSGTADTEFYIYYGNPDAPDGAEPASVWGVNTLGVWHMPDGPGSTLKDSTANDNTVNKRGTNQPSEVEGKIAKAQYFNTDWAWATAKENLNNVNNTTGFTISAWYKPDGSNPTFHYLLTKNTSATSDIQYGLYIRTPNAGGVMGASINGSIVDISNSSRVWTNGVWHHVVLTWDGSTLRGYVNGVQVGNNVTHTTTMTPRGNFINLGRRSNAADGSTSTGQFQGTLDDIRLENVARSAAWIKACYNNQDSPGSFYGVGGEESVYVSPGTIASQVLNTGVTGARWDALFWDETRPSNTDITFEVRANDTSFVKGDASPSWTPVGETSPVTSGLPSGRYMQWQATLTTSDPSQTPTLHEVRVYYSDY